MTATITIPFPVISSGSFGVVVKDHTGSTVFTGTETNAPFDVAELSAGLYTCYTTYNGNTDGWCFTVVDCTCPTLASAPNATNISRSGTSPSFVYFLNVNFDMSGDFPNCPFTISVSDGGAAPLLFTINSLADLTLISGTTYSLNVHLYSNNATYKILKQDDTICTPPTYLLYNCNAPVWTAIQLLKIASVWVMRLTFSSCGTSCHTFTVNYVQNYLSVFPGDSGSATITVPCGGSFPYTFDISLSPVTTYCSDPGVGPCIAYLYSVDDCCGFHGASAVQS